MDNKLDTFTSSYLPSFKFHDEQVLMHDAYATRVKEQIHERNIGSILSLGIGHRIVTEQIALEMRCHLKRYSIVEGSQAMIEEFWKRNSNLHGVEVVNSLFEEYEPEEPFEAIEMGFVLEHVDDPTQLLEIYKRYLIPNGVVFLSVPNARSLHRLIGYEAGYLDDVHQLSTSDLALGHKRYFDLESLSKLVVNAGLKIRRTEGIMLKPFTLNQLESLNLSANIKKALITLARDYPAISNAIYIEAVR